MLLHWIWLAENKDMTIMQKRRLLEQFPDPEELYLTSDKVLEQLHLPESLRQKDLRQAEEVLQSCLEKKIGILPLTDTAYPSRLRNIPDAPIVLYYKGRLPDWEAMPFIGVIGTRKASAYGLQVAHQMGGQIASCGGFVVSGCASGGDAAAMQGALDAGCPTVGVLGTGVDIVYPRCNRKLFEALAKEGCLISEYPPGTRGNPWHFPARNRIISGVSNGVLVVEAPQRSGALITVDRALEQGRDVFVVPGNINAPTCAGSNKLLQDGAVPVFSGWDVLSHYASVYPDAVRKQNPTRLYTAEQTPAMVAQTPVVPGGKSNLRETGQKKAIDNKENSTYSVVENEIPALSGDEQAVLAQLTSLPQEAAELIAKMDMPSGKVLSALTLLTVKGLVSKRPGGRFSRK